MPDNIREAVKGVQIASVRECQFIAHDEQETHIRRMGNEGWIIVNKLGLYLEYKDNLHRAMGDLYAITGITSDNWSITMERWV